jgi:hypothetical protein
VNRVEKRRSITTSGVKVVGGTVKKTELEPSNWPWVWCSRTKVILAALETSDPPLEHAPSVPKPIRIFHVFGFPRIS